MDATTVARSDDTSARLESAGRTRPWELSEIRWAAAALALFLVAVAAQLAGAPTWTWWALHLACYAAGGWEPALEGLRALRAKTLDVDLLMVVAALGAAAIGQVTDGALLIVIFATSGALEAWATARTEDSVRGLLTLAPDRAVLLAADGSERTVAAEDLAVGDVIRARPGDRIAADGTVIDGAGEVDQATITGEPLPVAKAVGDEVFAGTANGTGSLTIRVDRSAADSVVARIAAMVAEASRTKARAQLFIEKVEQRYSVGMVACTLAVFALPLALGADLRSALLRAMTFMIVASPCAVVLATMPPLLAAIAHAGRRGVLIKSAVVMENLASIATVAFDKTGTITSGRPMLSDVEALPGGGHSGDEVLALAAAVERLSEHPLAAAVAGAAARRGLRVPLATDFAAHPGSGVTGVVDGLPVAVVAPRAAGIPQHSPAAAAVARFESRGETAVLVVRDGAPIGVLALTDTARPDAAGAVAALDRDGLGTALVTGDNSYAAARVAAEVGIGDVRAGLLPDGKTAAVADLRVAGGAVAMVGDGVNDAPALASADAGIALGGAGSDLALRASDVVIVRDDLDAVPGILAFARKAHRVVVANLAIAATFIAVLVVWDLVGHLPLPLGVAGHEGSTVIVGLNGLRLLRRGAWPART
ncbi:heavy metal translocating P-type ATPase [Tsukamurella paurometabola]|uniref:Zinc-transporting ATPase n=1 Tax=Tsukamurella paurometabola TaxID=2061 RepID=A0A3P8MDB3_TSUPA|nr:heavy metal translocating P-type ATPase [Tsukamurella paurometabola]UEA81655.1 heavy metal translocating P-type ATPase [Tsukamurella paurometabola]VDR38663.1 Zinc-transporting ATPase [Tsukamurella paurometabola]